MEHPAVTNFREYIRIKTVQPNPDYASCVKFLKKQAKDLGASFRVTECVPGKPIVTMSVKGINESLPAIMLNSHTDVVPVFPEHWTYDPFSAHKDEKGNIFGRGTQDMKCVGMQYIEAMKMLKKNGTMLLRTVYMTFVPDEEIGGVDGMKAFVGTSEFKEMNIGFALDEGIASNTAEYFLYYGERNVWNLWVTCPGSPGHGSQFIENNAGKKLQKVINSMLKFRDEEEQKLKDDPSLTLGDVITPNLTMIEGGVQFNVLPAELSVGFNIRVPPNADMDALEKKIEKWCKEAGNDVSPKFEFQTKFKGISCVEDGKSPWWDAFSSACKKERVQLKKEIFPAGTDSFFIREMCGKEAFGFSPMNHTPLLLHDHDEYLNEAVFLRGIKIYTTIITHLANVHG